MGEIDTKSIESVQAALSLFGEKSSDKKKNRFSSCINVSQLLAKLCSASQKNVLSLSFAHSIISTADQVQQQQ